MCAVIIAWALAMSRPDGIVCKVRQVAPVERDWPSCSRSEGQTRAVVLLHGLELPPLHKADARVAEFDRWQMAGSRLVNGLSLRADVYALAYSENASVDLIAESPHLLEAIARLRSLGYAELVMIGHSAGGLVARLFVEDYPDAGVTKVIQVSAPNMGSSWAKWHPVIVTGQAAFVQSLSKDERQKLVWQRSAIRIPADIQFACVVACGAWWGDGMVLCRSQWPPDLQDQGVPAFPVFASHRSVMFGKAGVDTVIRAVLMKQERWTHDQVEAARKSILKPMPRLTMAWSGGDRAGHRLDIHLGQTSTKSLFHCQGEPLAGN